MLESKSEVNVENSDHEKAFAAIREASGDYFMPVRNNFFESFQGDWGMVIVLAKILNILSMIEKCKGDREKMIRHEMWFPCPVKRLKKELVANENRLTRIIKKLESCGVVETEHRTGNIQWVRINIEGLDKVRGGTVRILQNEESE